MTVRQLLQTTIERRRVDRRQPQAVLPYHEAVKLLLELRYTGPVMVQYADGHPREFEIQSSRLRIVMPATSRVNVLDKEPEPSESRRD